jgi:hypothetical protein
VEKVQKNLEDYPDLQSSLECESIADMLALN